MTTPRKPPVYIFHACLGDVAYFSSYRGAAIPDGARVIKGKGPGVGTAPAPYAYVKDAETGAHLGMVHRASLTLASKEGR